MLPTNGLEPSPKRARVSQGFADIFECRICSVSFCNHLGLHFHIALEQHQLRCITFGSQEISAGGWCECCGVTASHHALPDRTSDLGQVGARCPGQEPATVELCEPGEGGVQHEVGNSMIPKDKVPPGLPPYFADHALHAKRCSSSEPQLCLPPNGCAKPSKVSPSESSPRNIRQLLMTCRC